MMQTIIGGKAPNHYSQGYPQLLKLMIAPSDFCMGWREVLCPQGKIFPVFVRKRPFPPCEGVDRETTLRQCLIMLAKIHSTEMKKAPMLAHRSFSETVSVFVFAKIFASFQGPRRILPQDMSKSDNRARAVAELFSLLVKRLCRRGCHSNEGYTDGKYNSPDTPTRRTDRGRI